MNRNQIPFPLSVVLILRQMKIKYCTNHVCKGSLIDFRNFFLFLILKSWNVRFSDWLNSTAMFCCNLHNMTELVLS